MQVEGNKDKILRILDMGQMSFKVHYKYDHIPDGWYKIVKRFDYELLADHCRKILYFIHADHISMLDEIAYWLKED